MTNTADWRFETKQMHSGAAPDPITHARATPIYQTTSYVFDNSEHAKNLFALAEFGNIYTRIQNPTQAVVEERVAALEGGTGALLVASGQAAETFAVLNIAQAGDHIVSSSSIYGGTYNLFKYTLAKLGIETTFVENQDDVEEWRRAVRPNTKLFFAETIGNPKINVLDIRSVADVAHDAGVPAHRRQHDRDALPHPSVRARRRHRGALGDEVPRRPRHDHRRRPRRRRQLPVVEERREVPRADRARPVVPRRELHDGGRRRHRLHHQGPRAAAARPRLGHLAEQRMAAHPGHRDPLAAHRAPRQNTQEIAEWLDNHPDVASVNYSGLPSSPWYAAANTYAPKGVGAVLSFELKGGVDSGRAFVDNVALFSHLANIGDVRSLVIHPASTTHSQLTPEQQLTAGVTPGLVRLSVGIENIDDLKADLEVGFAAARAATEAARV